MFARKVGLPGRRTTALLTALLTCLGLSVVVTAPSGASVAALSYYPSGPQTNVPVSTVTAGGWRQCFLDKYANDLNSELAGLESACTGDYLMLAGRPTGSDTLTLLAAAPRSDVLYDTGANPDVTHQANGTAWYFNANWSWGFALAGDSVNKVACDVVDPDDSLRLCWHTVRHTSATGGYRLGSVTDLNSSTDYERLVFEPDTRVAQQIAFPPLGAVTYGAADIAPGATADSGLPVSYSASTSGVCTIAAGNIHIVGAGTCTVNADQPGDATYKPAPQVSWSFTVSQGTPTITTTPSAGSAAGGSISDGADVTLTGAPSSPSGTVTFDLYGPDDAACAGTALSEVTTTLSGGSASSGLVQVLHAGTYRWTASYNGDDNNNSVATGCGDATVVSAGALDHLVLSPGSASIVAGGSQDFTAEGFDAYDNSLGDVTADTTFSIAGGSCTGTSCTSTTSGAHTVTGSDGAATGTATLTLTPADFDHIRLSPPTFTIEAGGLRNYRATAYDRYGNARGDVSSATTFTVAHGSCTANNCRSTIVGTHLVRGVYAGQRATARLVVVAAAADHLVLSPVTATVTAGETHGFSAVSVDRYGNPVGDVSTAATFSINGAGGCTVTVSGADCGSTQAGVRTVTASYTPPGGGTAETGTANLRVLPGPAQRLTLTPATFTIEVGGHRAYRAVGYDQYGNAVDLTYVASFTITGAGECSANVCRGDTVGVHIVTATTPGAPGDPDTDLSATARLKVVPSRAS